MTNTDGLSDVSPPPSDAPRLFAFASLIEPMALDAERRKLAKDAGKPFGAVTGFPSLDQILGGALEPGLHYVQGSPGVGKTALGLQVGATCGCPALFVTTEMPPVELMRRHTARVTNKFLGKFKDGTYGRETVIELATQAAKAAPFLAILDGTQNPVNRDDIEKAALITRGLDETAEHFMLIVDSLHTWADMLAPDLQETERLVMAVAGLRSISLAMNCPVLIITERNRQSMTKGGLSGGAGTRKIEYSAESMIELHAELDKDGKPIKDADEAVNVKVEISKNRSGPSGVSVPLRFHGRLQKYTEGKGAGF